MPTNTRFAVAVHVLAYLAGMAAVGRTTPVGSEELAGSTAVNPVHVRKVLGPLRAAGLLRSRAGAHGGWDLAADPGDITLAQVWRLLQGDDPVLGLHGPNPACGVGQAVQRALVDLDADIRDVVETRLAAVTVADLIADPDLVAQIAAVGALLR
ncbi:Rrf2 family transcriptional regulator [Nocardioides fonticola]|uniref:Rrf2 family transcriptional regulator n=1 Tax=Nocardioides fonticola TaxID=450363 RepID=A0ABP7XDV9_9ACTN